MESPHILLLPLHKRHHLFIVPEFDSKQDLCPERWKLNYVKSNIVDSGGHNIPLIQLYGRVTWKLPWPLQPKHLGRVSRGIFEIAFLQLAGLRLLPSCSGKQKGLLAVRLVFIERKFSGRPVSGSSGCTMGYASVSFDSSGAEPR